MFYQQSSMYLAKLLPVCYLEMKFRNCSKNLPRNSMKDNSTYSPGTLSGIPYSFQNILESLQRFLQLLISDPRILQNILRKFLNMHSRQSFSSLIGNHTHNCALGIMCFEKPLQDFFNQFVYLFFFRYLQKSLKIFFFRNRT